MTHIISPALQTILDRATKLKTNSGMEIEATSYFPTVITPDMVKIEDSGLSMIVEIDSGGNGTSFVRLQSYDEEMHHTHLRAFIGKCVEVTLRVIEEEKRNVCRRNGGYGCECTSAEECIHGS